MTTRKIQCDACGKTIRTKDQVRRGVDRLCQECYTLSEMAYEEWKDDRRKESGLDPEGDSDA